MSVAPSLRWRKCRNTENVLRLNCRKGIKKTSNKNHIEGKLSIVGDIGKQAIDKKILIRQDIENLLLNCIAFERTKCRNTMRRNSQLQENYLNTKLTSCSIVFFLLLDFCRRCVSCTSHWTDLEPLEIFSWCTDWRREGSGMSQHCETRTEWRSPPVFS